MCVALGAAADEPAAPRRCLLVVCGGGVAVGMASSGSAAAGRPDENECN